MISDKSARIRLQIFAGLCCLAAVIFAALTPLSVNYWSFVFVYEISGALYCAALLCSHYKDRYLGPILEIVAAGFLLTIASLVSTYAAMSIGMPLADRQLIAMDNGLGFDWRAFVHFVDARPWLASALAKSYGSFSIQLLAIPILLCIMGKVPRACAFIAGYGLLCLASSVVAIWFPALGTYPVYGVQPGELGNINALFGYFFLESFHAVRAGPPFVLAMGTASGIVTFPSVHAAVACLAAWAMWQNRFSRYPFLIVNTGVCISAVSHANHYLVDIIAGIGIAALTVSAVSAIFKLNATPSPTVALLAGARQWRTARPILSRAAGSD